MKSWKTTLGGACAATGTMLLGVPMLVNQFTEIPVPIEVGKWSVIAGIVLTGFGVFFTGLFGRDVNVSSEGTKVEPTQKEP